MPLRGSFILSLGHAEAFVRRPLQEKLRKSLQLFIILFVDGLRST